MSCSISYSILCWGIWEYVITVQNGYINSFRESFEIPSVYRLSYLKSTGPSEGNATVIDIKYFTCNNTTFLGSFFNRTFALYNIFFSNIPSLTAYDLVVH